MLTAALFTEDRTWKPLRCPLTGWIQKMRYPYTVEYYSATKKNEIMPFAATCIDLKIIILSGANKKEKDKHNMMSFLCGI